MSKIKLQKLLAEGLRLDHPVFRLERIGSKLAGSIISPTFRRVSDRRRQGMIWNLLDSEMGHESIKHVGTLLAYTPEEWDIDLPAKAG
jgi:acid stress-induced BolA-like protein IbaG/YrbA